MPFAQSQPPMSAFEIFSQNEKSSYEKKYPNAKSFQIESMLTKAWDKLSFKEKDYYFELSKKNIESYTNSYYF